MSSNHPESGEPDQLRTSITDTDHRELSLDVIFEILKNRRRRMVLEYLRTHDRDTELSELAEYIAALENDVEVNQLSSSERKRVYISLYQVHLPKMDDAGVIDYVKSTGAVELTPAAELLFPYLDIDPEAAAKRDTSTASPLRSVADRVSDLF